MSVFDRRQVAPIEGAEPAPLEPPRQPLTGDSHAHLLEPARMFGSSLGYAVSFDATPAGVGGWCDRKAKRIVVADAPANAQLRTLIHEAAHALGVDYECFSRRQAEVIVDTVTFIVCAGVGLAVDGETIPTWLAGAKMAASIRHGAVETAIELGVAEVIADVVETGTSLRNAGLEVFGEPIMKSEAVVIRRAGAEPDEATEPKVQQFLRRLQGVLVARTYVMMDYDCRVEQLEKAVALTPGLESPTVSPLHNEGWVAVRAMVPAKEAQRIMDDLYEHRRPGHPDHGHPRLPSLSPHRSDAMPDATPDLPALPVTFRPGRTRVVLVVRRPSPPSSTVTAVATVLAGPRDGGAPQLRAHRPSSWPAYCSCWPGPTSPPTRRRHGRQPRPPGGAWPGPRSSGSTSATATPGCSSTSATAPACPRSASSPASPSSAPSPTPAPCAPSWRPGPAPSPESDGVTRTPRRRALPPGALVLINLVAAGAPPRPRPCRSARCAGVSCYPRSDSLRRWTDRPVVPAPPPAADTARGGGIMTTPLLLLAAAFLLILANGFFVAAEFGLVTVERPDAEQAAADGDRRARTGSSNPCKELSFQLSGTQLGITITSLVVGMLAEPALARAARRPVHGRRRPRRRRARVSPSSSACCWPRRCRW